MGKAAGVLGREFGKTAREMNALLKEHGYLYGDPGAYGLTDKGEQYAQEQYHSRGTGGYAHYNRSWETRTWNEETAAALAADIQAGHAQPRPNVGAVDQDKAAFEGDADDAYEYHEECQRSRAADDDDSYPLGWKELAVGGTIVGAVLIAPRVKPFWNNRLRPTARKLRDKLKKHGPVDAQIPEGTRAPALATGIPESVEGNRSTLDNDTDLDELATP